MTSPFLGFDNSVLSFEIADSYVVNELGNYIPQTKLIEIKAAIAADAWEWPRPTERTNGDVVFSPRDIVDTGELYDSLTIARNGNVAEFTWDTDYAMAVHDGATLKNGTELPARPWTDLGLQQSTAVEVMQRELDNRL